MVMGRPNKGIDHLDNCDCSELSKERGKLILRTISGELSVQEACEQMGVQRARFGELRMLALQGYGDALEPGRPGRPRKLDVERDAREAELLAKIASLERQLQVAEARVVVSQLLRDKKGAPPSPTNRGARQ